MGMKLKIGVACGGTGGHIFPGLATAQELADRGHHITLWLAGKDVEHDAVKEWTGEIVTIPAEGFQFGLSFRSIKTVFKLRKAFRHARSMMKKDRPDVLLAMGSYASYGPVKAATRLGVPYVLHEANLIPGRAVTFLRNRADAVAISFPKTSYYLKHKRIETTGMPLRKELQIASHAQRPPRADDDVLRLLVMGGSRGAQVLNEVVPQAIVAAAEKGVKLEVEHIAGFQDTAPIEQKYKEAGIKANVHQFVQHIEDLYPVTDLAVCRAGAATCAELALFGVPALLVPYPYAVRDHQMSNARIMQDSASADVVAQEDLTSTWLRDYLISMAGNPARLERMSAAMKKRAQSNAAERLADLLEKVAGSQS
jgi:UDP-N-acetylglucosamine--N-acetylmuramyl-(pentapeptide) pyrophosphoryl-undecaprenol N-acetylglucosamine transferase